MIKRPFWLDRIENAWRQAPIVWLAGVRRSGKTTLARSLGEDRVFYVNCDDPSVADMVSDPVRFYKGCGRKIVVFDEIHRLRDPSLVLKIGADAFPGLKILATGASTLAALRHFRDTLTGRKRVVHLTPVRWGELEAFGNAPVEKRLHRGGLPEALLAEAWPREYYREWLDSFFARDVHRLFALRDPGKFEVLFEYVLKQSGGLFEITRAGGALGISRPTIERHVRALEVMQAVTRLRPFHGGGQRELVKMPKVYAFDTGFVCFARGWDPLRADDRGPLWEHVVLESLQAQGGAAPLRYWRDASGREVDFVIPRSRDAVDAIECKWDPAQFDPSALRVFRSYYPRGNNYLICPLTLPAYGKTAGGLEIRVCDPDGWRSGGPR